MLALHALSSGVAPAVLLEVRRSLFVNLEPSTSTEQTVKRDYLEPSSRPPALSESDTVVIAEETARHTEATEARTSISIDRATMDALSRSFVLSEINDNPALLEAFKRSFVPRPTGFSQPDVVIEERNDAVHVRTTLLGKEVCYKFDGTGENQVALFYECAPRKTFSLQLEP